MNTEDKQKLVDQMQEIASILYKEGMEVTKAFECTKELNITLIREKMTEEGQS